MVLTRDDWHPWFYYDETSPSCLRWKVNIYDSRGRLTKARAGRSAGGLDKKTGYYQLRLQQVTHQVHRIIYEMLVGYIPDGCTIDHKDRNRANNRSTNMRATELNNRNLSLQKRNSSGTCGVGQTLNGWQAQWKDLDGTNCSKYFSSAKYGDVAAKEMAIKTREEAIMNLNQRGAGYTDTHGRVA